MQPPATQRAPVLSTHPSTFARSGGRQAGATNWRHEFKYVLPGHLRNPLTRDLCAFVEPDSHADEDGYYLVRSLYLDSHDWRCFHDKTAGLPLRHKLRVRGYVMDRSVTGPINFEVKQRRVGRLRKMVAAVGLDEYRSLQPALHAPRLLQDWWIDGRSNLATFFQLKHAGAMKPVLNVQFRRQAFAGRSDRNCRITIDDRLTARRARDLLDTMAGAPCLLGRRNAVLEIKVGNTIPLWLLQLVRKYHLQATSVSKYVYAAMNAPFGLEGSL